MLKKILWSGKQKWKIPAAGLGLFIGLLLLLLSFQFYQDLKTILSGKGETEKHKLSINKKLNLFNTLGMKSGFSAAEIESLKNQDFIEDLAPFSANQFGVSASSKLLGFYTELFFESVPIEFIEQASRKFRWEQGQQEVPIILSKDYLALYNFGFAPSQGLPQFTEKTITKVRFELTLRQKNQGIYKSFKGRVVGFSENINSILVPQTFMTWANTTLGEEADPLPSRLLLISNNPYSKKMTSYLEDQGYELSRGRLIGGKLSIFISTFFGILAALGLLICLLSILIFILNFQVLIAEAAPDIKRLLHIGYPPKQISQFLSTRFLVFFLLISSLVFLALFLIKKGVSNWLNQQGFEISTGISFPVLGLALVLLILFIAFNLFSIRRQILKVA